MQMMKSVAQEVADKKIRVNSIAPGAIKTNINKPASRDPAPPIFAGERHGKMESCDKESRSLSGRFQLDQFLAENR
jgi:NAD(P)-dependent dehydrogenase (short-subunit alcohol dehydrogenase family)